MGSYRGRSSNPCSTSGSSRAWPTPGSPNRRLAPSAVLPTRGSARRSSGCSRSKCRRRPRSWISSWRPCCAISSSSSRPMRLSASELSRFGEEIGTHLTAPAVIGLSGELGTGKTTLVQAICRGLGARSRATSPTYALVHHYAAGTTPVYHVDCYRLKAADEARDLGFEDMIRERAIVLVEWPERAGAWAPPLDRHFYLSYGERPDIRELEEVR